MLDVLLKRVPDKGAVSEEIRVSDRADKPLKSIMKAVSWRIVGTLDTMIISYFLTGRLTIAISIGSIEVFTKTVLYYFHERLWAHIHKVRLNIRREGYKKQYELDRIK